MELLKYTQGLKYNYSNLTQSEDVIYEYFQRRVLEALRIPEEYFLIDSIPNIR